MMLSFAPAVCAKFAKFTEEVDEEAAELPFDFDRSLVFLDVLEAATFVDAFEEVEAAISSSSPTARSPSLSVVRPALLSPKIIILQCKLVTSEEKADMGGNEGVEGCFEE